MGFDSANWVFSMLVLSFFPSLDMGTTEFRWLFTTRIDECVLFLC
ncbi:hypothetical protein SLEP1_g34808 [Rubroshorea leprosula]|uniref:Uncharacterized protein n=1 Tax=Rubroshorea leprosula TaxID=152421 RepID=A0AAV5KL80_9ROSI|nr:hypothetical protein SLEP1_g34808 [Rubroshorea leprosula]